MKKYIFVFVISISTTGLLSECKSTKTVTTTTTTTTPKEDKKPSISPAELDDISAGQELFTTKCTKCHDQPQPHQHDDAGWQETMIKMGPKSHLSDAQTAQVLKYLSVSDK